MMLSESQERMLMVLRPEKEQEAEAIFRKWGLDFAVIGKTTDTRRFVVRRGGEVKADLPIKELGDEAPLYDRPWTETPRAPVLDPAAIAPPMPTDAALLKLLGSPDLCSKRWIYEQYDTLILGNTIEGPGGDAAVVRLGDGPKGLALTTDCTERYCAADPREGGKQAVAEAWRNLIAVGARPARAHRQSQFRQSGAARDDGRIGRLHRGHRRGGAGARLSRRLRQCLALQRDDGRRHSADARDRRCRPHRGRGEDGDPRFQGGRARIFCSSAGRRKWLGRSAWLMTVAGREEGAPPPVDLDAERRNGEFVASLIRGGRVSAVHDLSDGGLAVALAEMAMAGGIGASVEAEGARPRVLLRRGSGPLRSDLQRPSETTAIAEEAKRLDVPLSRIGVTGGETLRLGGAAPVALAALVEAYETWLPDYMSRTLGTNP